MDETHVHGGEVGMDEKLRVAEPLNWPGRQRREEGRAKGSLEATVVGYGDGSRGFGARLRFRCSLEEGGGGKARDGEARRGEARRVFCRFQLELMKT